MANKPGTQSSEKTVQTKEAAGEVNLLDQVIGATRQTDRDQAQQLLKALTEEALKGTVTYSRNMTLTFRKAIDLIDKQLSQQVAAIMHHPDFLKLEGSWRGLNYLVMNSETSTQLKIKLLNASKKDLAKDLAKAVEFDQSELFKNMIYEPEFGSPGGEPYGLLIGDYEFSSHPEDIEFLTNISGVAAASFAPFISSANSKMGCSSGFPMLIGPPAQSDVSSSRRPRTSSST